MNIEPAHHDRGWVNVEGDEVLYLRNGDEAFPAMLAAIGAARREILLESYWIAPGQIGQRFRDALTLRASAGVTVKVLYDALGSRSVTDEWWRPLCEAGGTVREYHSLLPFRQAFRVGNLAQRDHRKLLVVDGVFGVTGGVNIGDEWLPQREGGAGWRDDAVAVKGEVVGEMRALFYRIWKRVAKEPPPLDLQPLPRQRGRSIYVLASQRRRRRSIHREYLVRIRGARRSIDLAHAYFLPDLGIRRALYAAVERGVRVRVLLPEVSDVPGLQFAVEATFDRLLERGVEIYALPPPMLHSKTAIVDRRWVTIGSYNLDERSWRSNVEANLAIVDERFAAHVSASFERDLGRARKVDGGTWKKRSLARRGAEWLALGLRELW